MQSARQSRPGRTAAPPLDTRNRLLQLAWDRIAAQGDAALSLVDLAREAGVSRQTLYLLFGSRAGLLLAMVEYRDAQSAVVPRLARARELMNPRDAFEPYLRAWFEYLPQVFPVARALAAHKVAVVQLTSHRDQIAQLALGEARVGAGLAGAALVTVDIDGNGGAVAVLTRLFGKLPVAPATLVYTRPATLYVTLTGFNDRTIIQLAAENAGAPSTTTTAAG